MKKRTIPHLQCRTDARVRNRLAQKNREPDAQPMVDVTDEMIVTRLTDDMKFGVMPVAFKNRIAELLWWFDPHQTYCNSVEDMEDEYDTLADWITRRALKGRLPDTRTISPLFHYYFWNPAIDEYDHQRCKPIIQDLVTKLRAAFLDTETRNQIYASYRAGLRSVRDRDACPKYEKTPAEVREEYQVLFDTIMKTSK